MKNNWYFRDHIYMEAVNLDEETTVQRMQKKKNLIK